MGQALNVERAIRKRKKHIHWKAAAMTKPDKPPRDYTGHLITAGFTVALGFIAWVGITLVTGSNTLAAHDVGLALLKESMDGLKADVSDHRKDTREDFRRVHEKLDKILERLPE